MSSPIFLMHGIYGLYNYGCEAILRGTEIILREKWPNAVIKYASLRPESDMHVLNRTQVKVVSRRVHSRYSTRNIVRRMFCIAGAHLPIAVEDLRIIDECDVVLSIGGDLYTLWPSGDFDHKLISFGKAVLKKGKKLVIWGASIGPFDKNLYAEKSFSRFLSEVSLITSREPESTDYMRKLGIENNVTSCADPAFAVLSDPNLSISKNTSLRIGMNFSPLSLEYMNNITKSQTIMAEQVKLIERVVNELGAEVVLIPHVVCDFNKDDDDFGYLQNIMKILPENISNSVGMLQRDLGFLGTKSEILRCNIVIAARMHCAINALASIIPTIFVSYSKKSIGMAKYVYGGNDWVVPIDDMDTDRCFRIVQKMVDNEYAIKQHLQKRIQDIQLDVREATKALAQIL